MADTWVCSIELSKTGGITVKVNNDTKQVTQTITMDGAKIEIKFKGQQSTSTITQTDASIEAKVVGPQATSTITQKQDSVVIACKKFEVTADETIKLVTTSGDMTQTSGAKLNVSSTGDMKFDSSAKYTLSATGKLAMSTMDKLEATATQDAAISGMNTKVDASMKVTVHGGTQAELASLQTDVKGDAQVNVKGPITQVGDQVTTIKGSVVQVQGQLVQLG